ncbi:hypothetical protein UA08_03391 [Talaromyces atroroseus]|uniref:RNA recognition motif domain-containing protein n=1 Tax=Talaromyces atroroseus TaxID=1441469 RepID=A0A225AP50_TALAT|nr:hypothetical protein UA08_03391 [Talaromyces atroroseus]OKL61253.1 hypothetical protein UA08_03391 [Talaromyces atroroseus]
MKAQSNTRCPMQTTAAAKKKEAEKREIEASSRKNLAGVRVVQKNLVYVIGLNPTIRDEGQLLQTLRGPEYFGQYGEIDKIVVSKAKPGGNPNQGIGVYVTFARKLDAATCIAAVDGSQNGDRLLRAQYGTTKYCSSFLRNEQCNNRNCTFLHETGDDSESYSRQDLSSMNTAQRHGYQNGVAAAANRPFAPTVQSQPMRRQGSKDEVAKPLPDGPALPSSASWANKDAPINRARRLSTTGSRSSPSPKPANVPIAKNEEVKKHFVSAHDSRRSTPAPTQPQASTQAASPAQNIPPKDILLESLLKSVNSPEFRFVFSTEGLSDDDLKYIENGPSFIDPYGGAKRRAMREKAEQERAKEEAEAQSLLQSAAAADEETRESGSLQLGGEPDDVHPVRGAVSRSRDTHGAIQPPSQQGTGTNSAVGSPASMSQPFQSLNMTTRSLTPLQQHQLMLLKSGGGQQSGLMDTLSPAYDQTSQTRPGLFQGSISQAGHTSNTRLLGQQNLMQSGNSSHVAVPAPQQGISNQFYTSSVQGPPPGLKTAGTPPISGGGMFAQGHGFTSNTNLGLGGNVGKQEANPDLMRELLRGRGVAASTGGLQGHESAKREFLLPFIQQHNTPPPLTPATGLLNAFYGTQNGAFADFGPQKQKKKGKKHRHANTSSGGGGVVDLADPSILQARMHQAGVGTTGQVLYGSQGQVGVAALIIGDLHVLGSLFLRPAEAFRSGSSFSILPLPPAGDPKWLFADEDFPPLTPGLKGNVENGFRSALSKESQNPSRSGTPSLPPGLPLPHGHPAAAFFKENSSPMSSVSVPAQAPPGLPASRRGTPLQKSLDISRRQTPAAEDVSENTQVEKTRNFGDISLGSPMARSARKANIASQAEQQPTNKESPACDPVKGFQKKVKPIKLDLSTPSEELPSYTSPTKEVPVSSYAAATTMPQSTATISSRPGTPLTAISRNSDSSGTRQPRVLRVVDTQKTETPPPPAVQSLPSLAQTKIRSRRPSLSPERRASTPADAGSDYEMTTSASASRANSPPPTKIGTAPVRAMTKNQAKKERRLKAKQAEEAIKEEVAAMTPEEPVQAPIVGRKRKTKKPPAVPSEPSPATKPASDMETQKKETKSELESQKPKLTKADTEKAASDESGTKPPSVEPWRANNTIAQLVKDAESTGTAIKDLFLERTGPLHVLLAQMHNSGHIDLNSHPLFNPLPLNQRNDMKCSADDYDKLRQPIDLTEEDRKTLQRGQPIRINGGSDSVQSRCLITPKGRILRHLSAEEEDQYLELESHFEPGTWNEYPAMSATGPDATNLNGGLDALYLNPGRFNIRWVAEPSSPGASLATAGAVVATGDQFALDPPSESAPPNVLSMMEADANRSYTGTVRDAHVETTARSFAGGDLQRTLDVKGTVFGDIAELDNVFGMSNKELRIYIDHSQRALESSRKEFDAFDKKLSALVKRNKKLAQQALGAAVEVGK